MSEGAFSASRIVWCFLGVWLPIAWLDHGSAVLHYATFTDFAQFLAISVVGTLVLALACWCVMALLVRLSQLLAPHDRREVLAVVVPATFLVVLATIAVTAWLTDYGIPARRTLLVPPVFLGTIVVSALRPTLVAGAFRHLSANARQMMRFPVYGVAVVGGCLLLVELVVSASKHHTADASPTSRRPSVVLITIDSFSATRSNLWGAMRNTTPSLTEFAQRASVFDTTIATTNFTASSSVSLQTGEYPWTHRVLQHQGYFDSPPATLAASLHQAGYRTAMFNANWLADPRHTLSAAGWDVTSGPYHAVPLPRGRNLCGQAVCDTARLNTAPPFAEVTAVIEYAVRAVGLLNRVRYPPDPVLADARDWIARNPGPEPVFLWIHLFPPHDPYLSPPPFLYSLRPDRTLDTIDELMSMPLHMFASWDAERLRLLEARYQESLEYVDNRLGKFMRDPQVAQLLDRSVVVITADHGESFARNFVGHTGPLLTQSLVRIPLIIRTPGMSGSKRISTPVSQTDIMPTILDLVGVPIPESAEGVSLRQVLEGMPPASRTLYTMNFENAFARRPLAPQKWSLGLVDWPWKYVEYHGLPGMSAELYNLADDPSETRNLASVSAQRVERYSNSLQRAIAEHDQR